MEYFNVLRLWLLVVILKTRVTPTGSQSLPPDVQNVALGASCAASSEQSTQHNCQNAVDGVVIVGDRPSHEWVTNGEGVGAWISLVFDATYEVVGVQLLQRCHRDNQNRGVELAFRDGSRQTVELTCFETSDQDTSCPEQTWQHFNLTAVKTSYVILTIHSVCTLLDSGFREIRILARTGSRGDPWPAAPPDYGEVQNVALHASCVASSYIGSSDDYGCQNAVDGVVIVGDFPSHEWVTNDEGVGAWISLVFDATYEVVGVQLLQRCHRDNQNRVVELAFSDASIQTVELACFETSILDKACPQQGLQHFNLTAVEASYLTLTIRSVCTSYNSGFREIKILARTGSRGDPWPAVPPDYGEVQNVALQASCAASSNIGYSHDYGCQNAVDGVVIVGDFPSHEWVTNGEGIGAWISLVLDATYEVVGVQLLQRCHKDNQNRGVELAFRDGSTQMVELACFETSILDKVCPQQGWQHFNLTAVETSYVTLTIRSVCTSYNSGFREIQILARKGSRGDPWPAAPPDYGEVQNVALRASCAASSNIGLSHDYGCQLAVDGVVIVGGFPSHEWVTNGEGIGAWISLVFDATYEVVAVQLLQRCHRDNQNRGVGLAFRDGSTQTVELACFETSIMDKACPQQGWQHFNLTAVETSYVTLTIRSVCTSYNSGFREIKILARTGSKGDPWPAVPPDYGEVQNVALHASCAASSNIGLRHDYGCQLAVDGVVIVGGFPSHEWVTNGEGIGAWISLVFDATYEVVAVQLLQRCHRDNQNRDVELAFRDSSTQTVELACFETSIIDNACPQQGWQHFNLTAVETSYVTLTIRSVCASYNSGFREIKILARTGSQGDPWPAVPPDYGEVQNVALHASCAASSNIGLRHDYGCQLAVDGVVIVGGFPSHEWVTNGEGIGAWISLVFNATYEVVAVQLLQRCHRDNQNRDVELAFSDASTQMVTLECFKTSILDTACPAQGWQHYDLKTVFASSVKLTIRSVCSAVNSGFREIKILARGGGVDVPRTTATTTTTVTVPVTPRFQVLPNYGPVAGGTHITITHAQLDGRMLSKLILMGLNLDLTISNRTYTSVIAVTPAVDSSHVDRRYPIYLVYTNGTNVNTEVMFLYKDNPRITSIEPRVSIARGGIQQWAKGENLNGVAEPRLFVYMTYIDLLSPERQKNETFTGDCAVNSPVLMTCWTPEFNFSQDIITTIREREEHNVEEPLYDDTFLQFYLGFRLDGVDEYRNLSQHPELEDQGVLTLYPVTPVVHRLDGVHEHDPSEGVPLVLMGEHLDSGVSKEDFTVEIGQGEYNVTTVAASSLTCHLPPIAPAPKPGQEELSITVRVGRLLSYDVGKVTYVNQASFWITIVSSAGSVVVVMVVLVAVTVYCHRRRKVKAPNALSDDDVIEIPPLPGKVMQDAKEQRIGN